MKTLAPGQDVDEYVELTQMFDTSEPGTYILQVSRPSPLDPAIILKSNTLTITVLPAETK
jgi:SOS-response transcriptional repressor LexA